MSTPYISYAFFLIRPPTIGPHVLLTADFGLFPTFNFGWFRTAYFSYVINLCKAVSLPARFPLTKVFFVGRGCQTLGKVGTSRIASQYTHTHTLEELIEKDGLEPSSICAMLYAVFYFESSE